MRVETKIVGANLVFALMQQAGLLEVAKRANTNLSVVAKAKPEGSPLHFTAD